jgi:hypothetical protein
VRAERWTKRVMNPTFNALSALTRGRYGPIVADAGLGATTRVMIDECVAVPMSPALHRDGPELACGRALSRPTKSPRAALRPTGARLLERLAFDDPPPPPPPQGGSDTGDSR